MIDNTSILDEALSKEVYQPEPKPVEKLHVGNNRFNPLGFTNAVDFLYTFDRALRTGQKSLHPWQVETLLFLSNKDLYKFRIDTPLLFSLLASNGSGKDAYVIAGFAAFVLCCWTRYKVVITSASDQQLDTQTRAYITNLCTEVNTLLRTEWGLPDVINVKKETFKSINYRNSDGTTGSLTGSEILTFVTNEGGKAEGHHPYPDSPPGEGVILIANEAKTIPGEIWEHFAKCTYNIFLKISSAGEAKEHFYNAYFRSRDWLDGYIPGVPFRRKVTYKDCLHLTPGRIAAEIQEHGENSPWFRMTRKSEFVSPDSSNVISDVKLIECLNNPRSKINIGLPKKAGLDIGGGGDPSELWVFDNNICIGREKWSFKDTQLTVDLLVGDKERTGLFNKYGLKAEDIIGDDNGLGQGVLDNLRRRGWPIRQMRAQFAAINKIKYLNRGAEWWFRFLRLIEEGIINFNGFVNIDVKGELNEPGRQLVSRHYTTAGNGKLKLQSKEEEKAEGFLSPNAADAIVLAFADVDIYEFIEQKPKSKIERSKVAGELIGSKVIVESLLDIRGRHLEYLMSQQVNRRPETTVYNNSNMQSLINSLYGDN